ncbi:MAG: rhodanese-like domain-containing protein [Desulfomonilaceae bacterium]
MWIRGLAAVFVAALLAIAMVWTPVVSAADEKLPSKVDASCMKCHADYEKAGNLLAGKLVEVANKSGTIQLQIDKDMEVIHFDDSTQLKNAPAFKDIPKQESVRITYIKKDGKNFAKLVEVKKGITVPKEQLADTEEVAQLIAKGPEAGKYVLLDSRPDNFYNEGHIPTAVSMPFFAFDKLAETLPPKNNEILQIYYCSGFS